MKSIILILSVLVTSFAQPSFAGHHSTDKNLQQTAESAGTFTTLLAAAEAAGLTGALQGKDKLTVFSPTDEAFNALQKGTVASLLKPENREQLADLLKFHIIAGRVGSNKLDDNLSITMLSGQKANIQAAEAGFTIQGAKIVATDIDASNGVIHIIDRVIMPETRTASASISKIERAIAKGAPLYNDGNPEATVALYRLTAENLLEESTLSSDDAKRLNMVLRKTRGSHNAQQTAWDLRYALDDVRASLMGDRRMSMTTY